MTEELSRTSTLASRHKALGSGLEDWNGMETARTYTTDPMRIVMQRYQQIIQGTNRRS